MKKASKRFKEAQSKLEQGKVYNINEAVSLMKQLPKVKFDESVDVAISLNIDPKKSDQLIRGTVVLPNGTGKKVRVLVFCKGETELEAKQAGADHAGGNELIDRVSKGFMDFDCVVATPEMMKDVSRLGKVLGPRGLMPSPKTGTVTNNVAAIIKELKAGKVEFRANKQGGIHLSIGRLSFTPQALEQNFNIFYEALNQAKPASVKGEFIRSLCMGSTMGPGFKIKI